MVETSIFSRKADALLSSREWMDLITLLAWNPLTGDVVPGTGGVRKLRFAGGGRGKRGAFRNVSTTLIQPGLAFRLDLVAWVERC